MREYIVKNSHLIREWIEALRNGTYVRTFATLRRDDNCFCAQGVLCEIVRQHNPDSFRWVNAGLYYRHTDIYLAAGYINRNFINQIFETTDDRVFDVLERVSAMNDATKRDDGTDFITLDIYSWSEIADYIETNLKDVLDV